MIFREWFESEQSKLTRKYGRYCINYTNAISIVKEHINYFSIFQLKNKLLLRIDGMLIKPIQRLTRYCDKNSYSIQSNNNLNNTRKSRSQSSERTLSLLYFRSTVLRINQGYEVNKLTLIVQGFSIPLECGGHNMSPNLKHCKKNPIFSNFLKVYNESEKVMEKQPSEKVHANCAPLHQYG